jgi:hypothetical protein
MAHWTFGSGCEGLRRIAAFFSRLKAASQSSAWTPVTPLWTSPVVVRGGGPVASGLFNFAQTPPGMRRHPPPSKNLTDFCRVIFDKMQGKPTHCKAESHCVVEELLPKAKQAGCRDHGTRSDHNLFPRSGLPAKGDACICETIRLMIAAADSAARTARALVDAQMRSADRGSPGAIPATAYSGTISRPETYPPRVGFDRFRGRHGRENSP